MLDPSSDAGGRVAGLWWVMFWTSSVVVAVVTGFLLAAVWRRRRDPASGGGVDAERDEEIVVDADHEWTGGWFRGVTGSSWLRALWRLG